MLKNVPVSFGWTVFDSLNFYIVSRTEQISSGVHYPFGVVMGQSQLSKLKTLPLVCERGQPA